MHISSLRATCVEARAGRAVLDVVAELDAAEAVTVTLRTEMRRAGNDEVAAALDKQHPLALGANRLRWRLVVPDPELWWPVGLGEQPLYDLSVSVEIEGQPLGSKVLRTGLRQVRAHDFIWSVNGERVFLKGANLAPTRRDLAYASPSEVARDVELALEAGLNMLRVHGHIGRPELYAAADELGVLIWQDMPLQWAYKGVRREAVRQAVKAVDLLGHHPSIAVWCGHNEPFSFELQPGGRLRGAQCARGGSGARSAQLEQVGPRQQHPAGIRASRPFPSRGGAFGRTPAPGVGYRQPLLLRLVPRPLPGPPRALAAWPAAGRFVGELGAQAVPTTAGFMAAERWPDLDWA